MPSGLRVSTGTSGLISFSCVVPIEFSDVAERALVRLGYIYPELTLAWKSSERRITATSKDEIDEELLKKELMFQLYREKIFLDTNHIRSSIYSND